MCEYFCIWFTDSMWKGTSLLDYTNLFSPDDYDKNDKIILKHLQQLKRWKNYILLFVACTKNLENLKYHTTLKNNISSFWIVV